MTADSDGFLGRWARRKAQARSGATLPPEPESAPHTSPAPAVRPPPSQHSVQGLASSAPTGAAVDPAAPPGPVGQVEPAPPASPPPTLQDAQRLTPASDFRPFVARAVAPEVRNVAFKQLFTDPHFNVMDGLDIYIDDYSKPDPLPLAVARELLAAHFPMARACETQQAATTPSSEAQAPAAHVADTASPDSSAALPCADAVQNGPGLPGRPRPELVADARRDLPPSDPAP
ncbi:DUF3306 domain-containing protein [Malikia sp.]|uniref:DUF3306 domain-containing protein n=1 Tax=Malikia sp. TaxID=2070706 RepID=UPI0026030E59|nr:DUF3306 domain-containing protein [Malikia sp.]MDD2729126.1 DUF3306 domain-containing protein [Malikia sp.]